MKKKELSRLKKQKKRLPTKYFKVIKLLIILILLFNISAKGLNQEDNKRLAVRENNTQQTNNLRGKVTDEKGDALPGVTIMIKGTNIGVVTDINGDYSLKFLQSKAELIFSFVGMVSKTIVYKGQSIINVVLKTDSKEINEVVVIGYGALRREALTGSATVINKDVLTKIPTISVSKALQGSTPGVQVSSPSGAAGADATIRIRGIGSLTATSSPLWVVDGVVGAPTPHIENIESITILKDAASAAIYGSRAANGVILITTKSGLKGKTRFDFQVKYSLSNKTQNKFKLLNSADYYSVSWRGLYASAIANGESIVAAAAFASDNIEATAGRNPYNVDNPFDKNGNVVKDAKLMIDEDWNDIVERTAMTQQYDLSASGGEGHTKFYFAIGYFDQDGIIKPDFYSQYTGRVNVTNEVNDKLTIGMKMNFSHSRSDAISTASNGSSTGYAAYTFPNNVSLYELDEDFEVVSGDDGLPLYNWSNKISQNYNPIGLAKLNNYSSNNTLAFASFNLNYNIFKYLTFNTSFSATYSTLRTNFFETGDYGDAIMDKGRSTKTNDESLSYISSSTLTYNKTYNDIHHLNFLLGYEFESYKYKNQLAVAKDYTFDFSDELSVGAKPKEVSSTTSKNKMIGMFSRLTYDYNNKYYTSLSIRRDASSKFAPDRRWGVFWSTSIAWRLSQEDFLVDINWLNNLKLKISYGSNGNAGIPSYMYMSLYSLGGNYNDKSGLLHTQLANSELRWEKNIMTNVGIDFGMLNSIRASLEFFVRKSDDLLSDKPLAYSTGWASRIENVGAMKNTGVEFTLNVININTDNFKWVTDFNIAHYKNEITSLTQDNIINPPNYYGKIWTVGEDKYTWYMKDYVGVNQETGAAQWYMDVTSSDGKVTKEITEDYSKATRYKKGSSLPDFYGALTNTLNYKHFTFSIQLYYSVGGKIYDSLEQMTMNDGATYGYQLNAKVLDAWTPSNKDSDIPQFIYNNTSNSSSFSSRFLYDATYLRIKNISFIYDLPMYLTHKIGMQSVKAFINVDNLYTFTNYDGLDPEQGISGNNKFSTIPNVRTTTIGLRIGL